MLIRRLLLCSLLELPFFFREKSGKKEEKVLIPIQKDSQQIDWYGMYKVTYERAKENKRGLTEKEIAIVRRRCELYHAGLIRYNITMI